MRALMEWLEEEDMDWFGWTVLGLLLVLGAALVTLLAWIYLALAGVLAAGP